MSHSGAMTQVSMNLGILSTQILGIFLGEPTPPPLPKFFPFLSVCSQRVMFVALISGL